MHVCIERRCTYARTDARSDDQPIPITKPMTVATIKKGAQEIADEMAGGHFLRDGQPQNRKRDDQPQRLAERGFEGDDYFEISGPSPVSLQTRQALLLRLLVGTALGDVAPNGHDAPHMACGAPYDGSR